MICGSRNIHSYERISRRSNSIVIIFKPEIVGTRASWPLSGQISRNIATRADHLAFSRKAENLSLSLLDEMTQKKPGFESAARGYVLQLCALIERELPQPATAAPDEHGMSGLFERMQAVIDYIHEKSEYPIMLEDVAEVASLSPWYFSRVFKKAVGTSLRNFVNEVRIERAEGLMANTEKTLADIALECGFENLRTFNRAYRALRSTTPSETRAGMR